MPLLNRGAIANFFGLADEEEYEYQDYPETQIRAEKQPNKITQNQQAYTAPQTSRQQMISARTFQKNVELNEEQKVIELHQSPDKNIRNKDKNNQTSFSTIQKFSVKIAVMEPRAYSEAMTIAKRIISGEATLVNFHLVKEKQARRIVDFLTGTIYALDGDIKRVGDEMFLCTPADIEIDSSTVQSFYDYA